MFTYFADLYFIAWKQLVNGVAPRKQLGNWDRHHPTGQIVERWNLI